MAGAEYTNPADGLDRDLSRDNPPDEPTRLGRAVVQFRGIYLKRHRLEPIIGYHLSSGAQFFRHRQSMIVTCYRPYPIEL
jgi:hypothetical protein